MISVVIPLYNKEKSIVATLQSVLAQTYTDYEVIVVNDGSTDNSANVVKTMMATTEKIRLRYQPNAGVSAARNSGIVAAKGEYIAFLDADDLWAPNYLETLAALIAGFPNAGLYSLGYTEIYSDNMLDNSLPEESHFRGIVKHPWKMRKGVWTGSVAAERERLIKVGMFDTRMTHGEDIDMWWRLILDGGLVVDTKCCAYYRQDTENRAMKRNIPLEKHIPYYVDKYAEARLKDIDFRRFFDREMIYRLYPYMFDRHYRSEAKCISQKFDYQLLKKSMRFRMQHPYLYKFLKFLKQC